MYPPGLLLPNAMKWEVVKPSTTNGITLSLTAQNESEREARNREIENFQNNFNYTLDENGIPCFKNTNFAAW